MKAPTTPSDCKPIGEIDPAACLVYAQTGHWHLRDFLTRNQQDALVAAARGFKVTAPMLQPRMRDGKPMSVRVSSFGERGWWSDEQGYRYIDRHPSTGGAFPPLPDELWGATYLALSSAVHYSRRCIPDWTLERWGIKALSQHMDGVDTCLVNHYGPGTQLGWHVDRTEIDRVSPIVTFSIGATCTFMLKAEVAEGEFRTFRHTLHSGDAIVMAGPSRLAEHTVVDVRPAEQAALFGENYNPIHETAPGTRLSFTVRRTGYAHA